MKKDQFHSRAGGLFAALLLLAAGAWAQSAPLKTIRQVRSRAHQPTGVLRGKVLDAEGKPVEGARVMVQTSDGRYPRAISTDEEGRFRLTRTIGPYDLRARASGRWSQWTRNVRVKTGEETSVVTLRIPSAPPPAGVTPESAKSKPPGKKPG
jgi:hypothetical protein